MLPRSKQNQENSKSSQSWMSYLWNSKGWFNPISSLSSTGKKVFAATLLSQVQPVGGDVCFASPNAPGGLGMYKLHCANGQESSLFESFIQNCSVYGTSCGISFLYSSTVQAGKSAFGYAICTLSSMMPAESCEIQILDMKVLNGYVPSLDGGPIAGMVAGGIALVGVVGVTTYCCFFRKPKQEVAPNENTRLNNPQPVVDSRDEYEKLKDALTDAGFKKEDFGIDKQTEQAIEDAFRPKV